MSEWISKSVKELKTRKQAQQREMNEVNNQWKKERVNEWIHKLRLNKGSKAMKSAAPALRSKKH